MVFKLKKNQKGKKEIKTCKKKVLEIVEFYYYFNENIPALRLKSTSNKADY